MSPSKKQAASRQEPAAKRQEPADGKKGGGGKGGGRPRRDPGRAGAAAVLPLEKRRQHPLAARAGPRQRTYKKQNSSSPSPVTDGKHVWVVTGNGVVTAFDFDGKELWKKNLQEEYGNFGLNWGYGSSPLLYQGQADHRSAARQEDRRSVVPGRLRWRNGQGPVAKGAADRCPARIARCLLDAAVASVDGKRRSSSTAATMSPATTRTRARNCGGPPA